MHDWNVDTDRAKEIQNELRDRIVRTPVAGELDYVAGADASFERGSDRVYAAVVVLEAETFEVVDVGRSVGEAPFPYVPGLLSFREAPLLLEAADDLGKAPDVLVCDGHGYAHPRRFGLACHVGVLLDWPTIGVAKNVLVGDWEGLGERKGATAPLVDDGEQIGVALRSRDGVNPIFVSVGHRVTLETAVRTANDVAPRYKIPEPIRAAHDEVNAMRESDRPFGGEAE